MLRNDEHLDLKHAAATTVSDTPAASATAAAAPASSVKMLELLRVKKPAQILFLEKGADAKAKPVPVPPSVVMAKTGQPTQEWTDSLVMEAGAARTYTPCEPQHTARRISAAKLKQIVSDTEKFYANGVVAYVNPVFEYGVKLTCKVNKGTTIIYGGMLTYNRQPLSIQPKDSVYIHSLDNADEQKIDAKKHGGIASKFMHAPDEMLSSDFVFQNPLTKNDVHWATFRNEEFVFVSPTTKMTYTFMGVTASRDVDSGDYASCDYGPGFFIGHGFAPRLLRRDTHALIDANQYTTLSLTLKTYLAHPSPMPDLMSAEVNAIRSAMDSRMKTEGQYTGGVTAVLNPDDQKGSTIQISYTINHDDYAAAQVKYAGAGFMIFDKSHSAVIAATQGQPITDAATLKAVTIHRMLQVTRSTIPNANWKYNSKQNIAFVDCADEKQATSAIEALRKNGIECKAGKTAAGGCCLQVLNASSYIPTVDAPKPAIDPDAVMTAIMKMMKLG